MPSRAKKVTEGILIANLLVKKVVKNPITCNKNIVTNH